MAEEQSPLTVLANRLEITNNNGLVTKDLRQIYDECNYYESIFSPMTSMNMVVTDGLDLRTSLPIVGGELVRFGFSDTWEDDTGFPATITNGSPYHDWIEMKHGLHKFDKIKYGEQIEKRHPMRVYKILDRKRIRDRVNKYVIACVTQDQITSSYKQIDSTYRGMTCAEIVNSILNDSFGVGLNSYDETVGSARFTFARQPPIAAILKIAGEAESKNSDSNFFFWQTNSGYHFHTLSSLLNRSPVRKFIYMTGNAEGDDKAEGNRILKMEESTTFDILDGITEGQYGVNVKYFDPVSQAMFENSYSHANEYYPKNWEKKDRTTHPFIPQNISKEFSDKNSLEKYLVSNFVSHHNSYCTERDYVIRNEFRRRQNFVAHDTAVRSQLKTNSLELLVAGDSNIHAGDVIEVEISASGEKKLTEELRDRFSSGKYLVSAVRHSFTGKLYFTNMTVSKASYLKNPDTIGDF